MNFSDIYRLLGFVSTSGQIQWSTVRAYFKYKGIKLKYMEVFNKRGKRYILTTEEEKFLKALKRLEKLNQGRLVLFGSGRLDVRLDGISNYRIIHETSIYCEGGAGGDDFD